MPMTNEEAKAMGDAIFNALQGNGLTGDVASWLTDLAIRVKRLEEKETVSCSVCGRIFPTYSAYMLHGSGACTGGF